MSSTAPIVVAMSGGVDSATAAAVLVEQGHRVVGVTMRLYNASGSSASIGGRCCGPRDIEDARRVCEHLDIPFFVVDFEADFQRHVVEPFVASYLKGETPNPCSMCNQHIKFTPLLNYTRAIGSELLATGHYARIDRDAGGEPRLRRGVDMDKDQSYFLAPMPRDELASILFPLGDLTKEDVRALARRLELPVAGKAESQEICFVPDGDYAGFVARHALTQKRASPPAGDIVDGDGQTVGRHKGIHHYTIGQRRGLGNLTGVTEPMYVVGLEREANRILVGPRSVAERNRLTVRDVQWFCQSPTQPMSATVQVRHRSQPLPAEIRAEGARAVVQLVDNSVVAAPGQAAVFYQGDTVLGGGWIDTPRGATQS